MDVLQYIEIWQTDWWNWYYPTSVQWQWKVSFFILHCAVWREKQALCSLLHPQVSGFSLPHQGHVQCANCCMLWGLGVFIYRETAEPLSVARCWHTGASKGQRTNPAAGTHYTKHFIFLWARGEAALQQQLGQRYLLQIHTKGVGKAFQRQWVFVQIMWLQQQHRGNRNTKQLVSITITAEAWLTAGNCSRLLV